MSGDERRRGTRFKLVVSSREQRLLMQAAALGGLALSRCSRN